MDKELRKLERRSIDNEDRIAKYKLEASKKRLKKTKKKRKSKFPKLEDKFWLIKKHEDEEMRPIEIAELIGCSVTSVFKAFKEHDIKTIREDLVYKTTAAKILGITVNRFEKLNIEPRKYVPNPHYSSGPKSSLYRRSAINKLKSDPRVMDIRIR